MSQQNKSIVVEIKDDRLHLKTFLPGADSPSERWIITENGIKWKSKRGKSFWPADSLEFFELEMIKAQGYCLKYRTLGDPAWNAANKKRHPILWRLGLIVEYKPEIVIIGYLSECEDSEEVARYLEQYYDVKLA